MWTIISIIIVGGIAGWLASKIMGTDAQQGLVANVVVGIVGAFIGGLLFELITGGDEGFFADPWDLGAFLVALVGAIIAVWIWKMVSGRRSV